VFLTRGFQDATISEIVAHADIAMGTFYLHFRDKAELFSALAEDAFRDISKRILNDLGGVPDALPLPVVIQTVLEEAYPEQELYSYLHRRRASSRNTEP
jgi:AcrR family transcriptional regulator